MLFEGDGGFLFHIQELETLKRQGYRILMCLMNDGGYGSEFHKLRADGLDDSLAIFGRPAFEKIARGFDLRGHEIRDVSVIPKLFADFTAQGESEIWNIQITDQVTAPIMRQTMKRGHGRCERCYGTRAFACSPFWPAGYHGQPSLLRTRGDGCGRLGLNLRPNSLSDGARPWANDLRALACWKLTRCSPARFRKTMTGIWCR